jgi:hypothetical protein
MTTLRVVSAILIVIVGLNATAAAQSPPAGCKPVERYGVKGCEPLPDQTCPPGYHKEAVGPPDPRMKAPTVLMCVPDKPEPKEQKNKPPEPRKSTR